VRVAPGDRGRLLRVALATGLALVIGQAAVGAAQAATTVNVNPAAPGGGNSFPFGRADVWPQMGFVYKDIPAFDLKTGDTIAFDLSDTNDVDIQLQIDMAATTVNGGDVAGAYTTLVNNTQLPVNPRGNIITGDYELQFTAQAPFHFPGGGLIIRFSNPAGAYAADLTPNSTLGNLATSTDPSGFFVKRFFNDTDGLAPYEDGDLFDIAGFRLSIADVPTPPASAPTATPKKKCKKKHKRAAAAKKKCKKHKK
jgi:hypothetical protein